MQQIISPFKIYSLIFYAMAVQYMNADACHVASRIDPPVSKAVAQMILVCL